MPAPITLDEIKKRLHSIFKDEYDFDFSNFINTHSKIGVRCKEHGWNQQVLKNLFKGSGCRKCSYKTISNKNRFSAEDVKNKFLKAHGDKYDYSNFDYKGNTINSTIICPIHGKFEQTPYVHSKGHGCPSCSKNKR